MARDSRYDILFEPVRIGPVTAPNRFYQVPHCNGMGRHYPASMIEMRRQKAEGGWGVVCTEQVDIHPTSDVSPAGEIRMWDDRDLPVLARTAEAIHEHGALAGIELTHNGTFVSNLYSREVPLGPVAGFGHSPHPVQARAMDREDIRAFRRWHREAALRAKRAGFDLIYVYAAHNATLQAQFLSRLFNQRSDEYGGSIENRARLLGETLEETREAVGDSCGIVLRFSVDTGDGPEGMTPDGDGRAVVEMFAEVPDLWDVNIADWSRDSMPSRFGAEGHQEPFIGFVKQLTGKPVVGVGRYTSPDAMVSAIRRGVMDLIGAARPSIADPFLPRKIEEGRLEDIRECIGCNICVSGDMTMVPMRCTQNPTIGEEWRRGWHPETILPAASQASFLIVGAGPAGLECARALGARGYRVTLADRMSEAGGRVSREARLPGLSEWARVRDHRLLQIARMPHVELYLESLMGSAEVTGFGVEHVVLATGASWRRDGLGREHHKPIPGSDGDHVFSPDDVMDGALIEGPVLVFDTDHYYMGSVIAEHLHRKGQQVILATPESDIAAWSHYTLEQVHTVRRLTDLGIVLATHSDLETIASDHAVLCNQMTGGASELACRSVVLVTSRAPEDGLFHELVTVTERPFRSVTRIGDCFGPGTIAAAVHAGHRHAREVDTDIEEGAAWHREFVTPDPRP